jgi:hypothetical protein
VTVLPSPASGHRQPRFLAWAPALFTGAVFAGASLLFLVQPMMTKLVLPSLGGSPAVWNTSLCFFQATLLVGYAYAHALQRFAAARTQAIIHAGVLIAAALTLPLRLSDALGPPNAEAPALWLLGVLALSIGLPFAALSATAPLVQAWYARVRASQPDGANPYTLYAASNLGSLIALLSYPTLVEPLLRLPSQTQIWSAGFALFAAIMLAVGTVAARAPAQGGTAAAKPATHTPWRERITWMALAAAPSSLMLGVTTHISTDVASAPFVWVAPLALYLVTFIIAFRARPLIRQGRALLFTAPLLSLGALMLPTTNIYFPLLMLLHLTCFFLTALACCLALAARRPEPARLTQFYLLMSLGGVLGGAFNALVAPEIFSTIAEYPLVLALISLACALGEGTMTRRRAVALALGMAACLVCLVPAQGGELDVVAKLTLAGVIAAAFVMRERAAIFFALVIAATMISLIVAPPERNVTSERSFFGILRIRETDLLRTLAHGTTLHGAQALSATDRCKPLLYYAEPTPVGQAFSALQASRPALTIGAVGMGAGSVAAYTRPGDSLRFYEIDPHVIRAATDPALFSYINGCAQGAVDTILGDARLSLAREPANRFDLLLVDAFSSDSIPVHLITVEAMKLYLDRVTPDGIVVMHLSNRHLELVEPVARVAQAAGGHVLVQRHLAKLPESALDSDQDAIIVARNAETIAMLRADPRWTSPPASQAPVWSDDYVNLFGALLRGAARKRP